MSTKPKAAKHTTQPVVAASRPTKPRTRKAATAPVIEQTGSKQSQLIAMLQTSRGCTITQMTDLTGWQPHTVRGVISAVLRKKMGLDVACEKTESGSSYKIVAAAR